MTNAKFSKELENEKNKHGNEITEVKISVVEMLIKCVMEPNEQIRYEWRKNT